MVRLAIPIKFKISIERDDADGYANATDYMNKPELLKPVKIMVSTAYAESLEYGTAPLSIMTTLNGMSYSWKSVFDELVLWASRKETRDGKFPITSKGGQIAFARNLTNKFFEEGMKPHPYFRPSMDWMMANMQRLFDEGNSMLDIARMTLEYMNRLLIEGDHIFNGDLQKSMSAHVMDYDETVQTLSSMNDTQWEELYGVTGWDTNESGYKSTQ